jgi:hypothetical protein
LPDAEPSIDQYPTTRLLITGRNRSPSRRGNGLLGIAHFIPSLIQILEPPLPFVRNYLRSIDPHAKRVEMDLIEGLVELNVPGK